MSEERVVNQTIKPLTRSLLVDEFRNLGIEKGMTIIVHSAMSKLGWVCGGPVAVIQALQDVLTSNGTLVMPTHTSNVSDPKEWGNPAIPESWWAEVRREMPAFDAHVTPTYGMGQIAETFRTMPGVLRSNHPRYSFTAWGKNKSYITKNHSLDYGMGENSPLGKIYALDGFVLLLGTGYENNTSMHLGEHLSMRNGTLRKESPVLENGVRVWQTFTDLDYNDEIFNDIGQAFDNDCSFKKGRIGNADVRLMKQKDVANYTASYIQKNKLS